MPPDTLDARLSARIPQKLKDKLDKSNMAGDISRIALEDFFAKYPTQTAVIEAVVRANAARK